MDNTTDTIEAPPPFPLPTPPVATSYDVKMAAYSTVSANGINRLTELGYRMELIEGDDDLREMIYEYQNNPDFDQQLDLLKRLEKVVFAIFPQLSSLLEDA